ncbi:SAM-dependent methyltransferase [Propionibacteriaceae bacterium G57]|uniref:SAM-dependent methyltransferase n=1 Tax=Aestuariimicrobium sp. G57 TaxID=3418485 RepID=UPI003DA70A52
MVSSEFWDERYRNPQYLFGYRPNDFLKANEIMLRHGSRVLCIGDGEGRNGVWLAERGHQVTTVDISPVGVDKARALAAERGVELDAQVADLTDWVQSDAAQQPWDAVVSIFCHLPGSVRGGICQALVGLMAPGAKLVLESYSPAQLQLGTGGPPNEDLLLTRERALRDWAGLVLDVHLVERRIFEGPGHQGLSSVVQVLGQKPR